MLMLVLFLISKENEPWICKVSTWIVKTDCMKAKAPLGWQEWPQHHGSGPCLAASTPLQQQKPQPLCTNYMGYCVHLLQKTQLSTMEKTIHIPIFLYDWAIGYKIWLCIIFLSKRSGKEDSLLANIRKLRNMQSRI